MPEIPVHVDISKEIEDWEKASLGKDVRAASVNAFSKIQEQTNQCVDFVVEKGAGADQAVKEAQDASKEAKEAVQYAKDISDQNKTYVDTTATECRQYVKDTSDQSKSYVDNTVAEYKQYADNQLAATTEKASQASASAVEAADSAGTAQQAARTADEKATAAGNSAEDAKKYAQQAAGTAGFDGSASTVSTTDTHSLGSTNVQGQLDALAVGLKNIDVEVAGKDISETVIDTLDTITDSFPVPAAKEWGRTFFGKVRKFIQDFNAIRTTLLTLSKIVNNGLTTEEGYVADARQLNPDIEGSLANQLRIVNSNLGNIQVATLTVSAPEAVIGQEVRITNSAYTITANFDGALSVTIPIYTWGEYTITSGILASRKINITNDQSNYEVTLYYRLMLYDNGDECTNITGGWTVPAGSGAKAANHIQLNNIGNGNTYAYSSQKVDTRGYSKLYMLFDCTASTHSGKYSGNIGIATTPNMTSRVKSEGLTVGAGSGLMIEMDITQYQADYYVLPYTYFCATVVRQIWLE